MAVIGDHVGKRLVKKWEYTVNHIYSMFQSAYFHMAFFTFRIPQCVKLIVLDLNGCLAIRKPLVNKSNQKKNSIQ